jgi:hypothetical protein
MRRTRSAAAESVTADLKPLSKHFHDTIEHHNAAKQRDETARCFTDGFADLNNQGANKDSYRCPDVPIHGRAYTEGWHYSHNSQSVFDHNR